MATSLGLNERLFVVDPQEVHELVGTGRLPEPKELWDQEAGRVLGAATEKRGRCLALAAPPHRVFTGWGAVREVGMATGFEDAKGREALDPSSRDSSMRERSEQ